MSGSKGFNITNQKNQLIGVGKLHDGIYKLDGSTLMSKERVNAVADNGRANSPETWHRRLGHLNYNALQSMKSKNLVDGIQFDDEQYSKNCNGCFAGKFARVSFQNSSTKTDALSDLIHSDVCGPLNVKSSGGYSYVVTFIDDYSRFVTDYLLKAK